MNDTDLKYDIDSRLTQFEDRVKSQLEWYQEELKRLTEANRKTNDNPPKQFVINAGDIESDDEEEKNQRAYELQRINDLEKKLNAKDDISKDLKNMVKRLEMELEDMRANMNEKNNAPPPMVAEEKKIGGGNDCIITIIIIIIIIIIHSLMYYADIYDHHT